jgi:glucoamylase
VCAAPSPDPRCTVDPGTVPKAIDVLVPAGMNQAEGLDCTVQSRSCCSP